MLHNIISPKTIPVFGEFNNMKPLMYMDVDPTVKNRYKGVVYIAMATTNTPQDLRHTDARNTGYDTRNDPAFHYTGVTQFEMIQTVRTGVGVTAVPSLNDLHVTDDENELIDQDWLNDQLAILNGKKSYGGLSARNTHQTAPRRQRVITKKTETNPAFEPRSKKTQEARDSALALSAFNKMIMQQLKVVNRLQQGNVAVVFVALGTNTFGSYLRKEGVLFNKIPPAIFSPNIELFATMQNHFGLLEAQNKSKLRYIDYLDKDASLNVITFKPRHGKFVTKRPSQTHNKSPNPLHHTTPELERYKCFSEMVDINSGGADLIVIKNDEEFPIMNYLVQTEGSIYTASHLAHIGNLVPHWTQREMFTKVS